MDPAETGTQQEQQYYTTIPHSEYFPYYSSMPNSPPVWPSDDVPFWYVNPPPSAPTSTSSSASRSITRASVLTPAIVAVVALIGSAILLVSYYKIFAKYCSAWQNFWGLTSSRSNNNNDDLQSDHHQRLEQQAGWYLAMNRGLDESIVRSIPVYIYRSGEGIASSQECVVCLGEFEEEDELRILPKCSHAFHLSCIDVWLRSHSSCPLCRAPVICFPPAIQTMESVPEQQHEEEQVPDREQAVALQIEDDEVERRQVLQRSVSLRADLRRKSWRWRRCNSTGSSLVSYGDIVLSTYDHDQSSASPASNLILVPHNSAELDKQLSELHDDGYVVLNIEVASASSSNEESPRRSSSSSGRLSVRKSLFKASSLKRSFSAGRVFSFQRFARSRSVA